MNISALLYAVTAVAAIAATGCDVPEHGDGQQPPLRRNPTSPAETAAGSSALLHPQRRREVHVMTYNIRHGDLAPLSEIAEVIDAYAPDLVGLQEVDQNMERSGFARQAEVLVELTGMHYAFECAVETPPHGEYGVALLSRYPITSTTKLELPSGQAEQRILLLAEVAISEGFTVPVGVTHFGLTPGERVGQAQATHDVFEQLPWSILAGDLNVTPQATAANIVGNALIDTGLQAPAESSYTFPARDPSRRIDYVFSGTAWDPARDAFAIPTSASDHLPLLAILPLPSLARYSPAAPTETAVSAPTTMTVP